jgi:aminoglycoside phosphotransferase (APT) family kinase protein
MKGMAIANTRPMTIIHGDLNSGNVWKSKAHDGSLLLADWQIARMAPPGADFFTMFLFLDTKASGNGQARVCCPRFSTRLYPVGDAIGFHVVVGIESRPCV